MPIEQGFGLHGGDDVVQQVAEGFAFQGQSVALVITEARALSQLLFEHANLLLEVVDQDLSLAVYPSGTAIQ